MNSEDHFFSLSISGSGLQQAPGLWFGHAFYVERLFPIGFLEQVGQVSQLHIIRPLPAHVSQASKAAVIYALWYSRREKLQCVAYTKGECSALQCRVRSYFLQAPCRL
jgi:hypothetical protein